MTDFVGPVLLLGANGETGQKVVQVLERYRIPLHVLVRSEEKATGLASALCKVFIGEVLNRDDLRAAMQGTTAVISTLGTRSMTDLKLIEDAEYTTILKTIELAHELGLTHFVLCSSMGTEMPERIPALKNILQAKRQAEEALIGSGLSYTIVHPGGLRDEPGGQGVLLSAHPGQSFGAITREDVAKVLVQALLQPQGRNRSVDIINQANQEPAQRPDLFI